ncbi:MAG: hypothetical protein M3Y54_00240 [Bacteroidota bacterium]|nr:hypothetical protein [Bacteroidota bacterium]
MKNTESNLQTALSENLLANLPGLSEKRAKKLQKTVARATKKIARKFAKLLAKQHKGDKPTALSTVPPVPRKAATRRVGSKAAPQPITRPKAKVAAAQC